MKQVIRRVTAFGCAGMLFACGPHADEPSPGSKAQVLALEGVRNEAFRNAAVKYRVPLELLVALAHHQGRFELPPGTSERLSAPPEDPQAPLEVTPPARELDATSSSPEMTEEPPPTPDDAVVPEMALEPDDTDLGLQTSLAEDTPADDPEAAADPPSDLEAALEGDAHSGLELFGVMYLTPEQVELGARLTGHSPQAVRDEVSANIDAAAALLAAAASEQGVDKDSDDLTLWSNVIGGFVGAEGDAEITQLAMSSIEGLFRVGFDLTTEDGERLAMQGMGEAALQQALKPGDYPKVQFIAAAPSNYSSRGSGRVRFVVVHDIEGTMPGAIAVFRRPGRNASAHYIVRSSDGHIVQMVNESKKAWHCGHGYYNANSIGIEHEGFADRPRGAGYYTARLYTASAGLVCAIAKRYRIPIDRKHIFGHGNTPSSSGSTTLCSDARANRGACGGASHHHDPGRFWDWATYLRLIARCVANKPAPSPNPKPTPQPNTTVKGLVYRGTDTSARIEGALVRLGTRSTRTDAHGLYEFAHLSAGTTTVTATAPGYATGSVTRTISGKETWASIGLRVAPTGTAKLIGVVMRANGARIAGVTVRLSNGRSATTNATGVYTVTNLPPGSVTITATKSGIGTASTTRVLSNGTETWGSVRL
jgi:N-acetyl-anhydromuramyl-L-alanine amidase AmpD